MNELSYIAPESIKPLHAVRNQRKMRELSDEMKKTGWKGTPLLVIQRDGAKKQFIAWTGSHRIAAAIKAGLGAVPCHIVPEGKLIRHGFDADWGVDDSERLSAISKIGDDTATHIMWLEGRTN